MSGNNYGSDRRNDLYSVLDRYTDIEIDESVMFTDDQPVDDVVVVGWPCKPNVNVGYSLHENDRNVSDIPYELTNRTSNQDNLTPPFGNIYLTGSLADDAKNDYWEGAQIMADEDVDADIYIALNSTRMESPNDIWRDFHGADVFVAELLRNRFDTLDEEHWDYCMKETVRAADEEFDEVFGVGDWEDERVYIVGLRDSDAPDPAEASAEIKFPPGTGAGARVPESDEINEILESNQGEQEPSETREQDPPLVTH